MTPHPRLSRAGLELVERFEGLRRRAARLPGGGWTIGYGHTASAREGAEVTPDQAEALLLYDLDKVARAIEPLIFTPLNRNQFNALVAFAFNIGVENFRTSAVLRRVNEGALLQAASAIELWRRADLGGDSLVVDGLVRRRAAEKVLFLTPPDGFRPVPTPVVRAAYDSAAADLRAQGRGLAAAADVRVPLDGEEAIARFDGGGEVEDAARNVADRLRALFPEPEGEPAPVVEAAAPVEPTRSSEPESAPALEPTEPESTAPESAEPEPPEPESPELGSPEPEPAAPEPPPVIQPHPIWTAPPTLGPEPPPPLAAGAGQTRRVFEPESLLPEAPEEPPLDRAAFRRPAEPSARKAAEAAEQRSRLVLAAGVLGLLMFMGGLSAMLLAQATLLNLAVGLAGVVLMVPAGLNLLARLFGEQSGGD